jgi:hypothetical protein
VQCFANTRAQLVEVEQRLDVVTREEEDLADALP